MNRTDTLPYLGTVDVAVIGGGPAGAACALALRTHTSRSVALIEATTYEGVRVGENVSSAILPLLEYLDVKERFLADGAYSECAAVQASWGHDVPLQQHAFRHWSGAGYLLDRRMFDALLAETLHARGGKLYLACRSEDIRPAENDAGWILSVRHTSGQRFALHARFLVDASGRKASIARHLGASSTSYDTLIGVSHFFALRADHPHAHDLLIESTPDGWWYSAPLPDHRLVMSFMTDAPVWQTGEGQNMEKWWAFLQRAPYSSARLQKQPTTTEEVGIRPAHSQVLNQAAGKGWLATGDAAASFDPLSSLGIGFAIHAACHAALAITDYLTAGSLSGLQAYTRNIQEQFARYLPTWQAYYARETRWNEAPFWQKRREISKTADPALSP